MYHSFYGTCNDPTSKNGGAAEGKKGGEYLGKLSVVFDLLA